MINVNNYILLYGEPVDYPRQVSVDGLGRAYYKFNMAVQRESGIIDILPIVVGENTQAYSALADIDEQGEIVGAQILVKGEIRARSIKKKRKKLDVSVKAFEIAEDDDYRGPTNQAVVIGHICKEVPLRETPRGFTIADICIAVNRNYGSDYIPAIMWNGTAKRASKGLQVGDMIEAVGRLQSREYIKVLGEGDKETRTCYELSVNSYELREIKEVSE